MNMNDKAQGVLKIFATYGFRKASMGDIAKAADLSRQSIYNQFGSKEAVLEWAVTAFLDDITERAVGTVETAAGRPEQILIDSYQAWIGDHVPLIRGTPHGGEILETAIQSAIDAPQDYENRFSTAVAELLVNTRVATDISEAKELAHLFGLASKGLLLKCDTSEAFTHGMERVVGVVLRRSRRTDA